MGKGIFFTSASMVLAFIITATFHLHHHNQPPTPDYAASKMLRSNGFNFIARFLHISPSTPQTIFAIPDSAISNLSIPPYLINHLLSYHILPAPLTIQDLFNKPLRTCLPTLIPHQRLAITKNDNTKRLLEINNVLITRPNLFRHGSVIIHGVAGSFASFDPRQERISLPICESLHKHEWGRIVKLLTSSGSTAFAIGLKAVSKDFPELNSVTIFTPPNVALKSSSPLFMRFHILPHRYSFKQLAALPPGASLPTLATGKHVDITDNSRVLSINGVAITAPDLFVSKNFVIHGIARPLNMYELSR